MVCPSHLVIPATVTEIFHSEWRGVWIYRAGALLFPYCSFPEKASLNKQPSTFLIAIYPFLVREQATVPHMKEEDKTFHMNPITLISKMKQCCFQTNHISNQPARWVQNIFCGNLNDIKLVTDITKFP